MNSQGRGAEAPDDRDDTAAALSTLANPRRVRWSSLSQADASDR